MAGIKKAMKRVMDEKNLGTIVSIGEFYDRKFAGTMEGEDVVTKENELTRFAIIRLDHDGGLITEYDYGSDIRLQKGLKEGDRCMLILEDNWSAKWVLASGGEVPQVEPYCKVENNKVYMLDYRVGEDVYLKCQIVRNNHEKNLEGTVDIKTEGSSGFITVPITDVSRGLPAAKK